MIARIKAFLAWLFGLPGRFWRWCCAPRQEVADRVATLTEEVDHAVKEARVEAKKIQRKLRLGVKGDVNNWAIADEVLQLMAEVEKRHE